MASSELAVWILAGLALVLAIAIPLLNAIPKLSSFISLRWSCVAVVLLIMVGVVIGFEPLSDSTRDIAITGGIVILGIYLVLRTVEKILSNGWHKSVGIKGSISKGDTTASIEIKPEETKVEVKEEDKGSEMESKE